MNKATETRLPTVWFHRTSSGNVIKTVQTHSEHMDQHGRYSITRNKFTRMDVQSERTVMQVFYEIQSAHETAFTMTSMLLEHEDDNHGTIIDNADAVQILASWNLFRD